MILVDTSAWIEFLRATGSPVHRQLRSLIEQDDRIATTDLVVLELLAGARSEERASELRRMLMRYEFLPLASLDDAEQAAALYRQCRRSGLTIRGMNDCVIAAVAIRTGAVVLHFDRDFDAMAKLTTLRTCQPHIG